VRFAPCNVDFFFLIHFTPLYPYDVGLYSPAGGKNELEEKKSNIARDETHKKNL
jgi:hypothetical protein